MTKGLSTLVWKLHPKSSNQLGKKLMTGPHSKHKFEHQP